MMSYYLGRNKYILQKTTDNRTSQSGNGTNKMIKMIMNKNKSIDIKKVLLIL